MSSTRTPVRTGAQDFFATPWSAFRPLVRYLPTATPIWEPACGDGRLVVWMRDAGLKAAGADLHLPKENFNPRYEVEGGKDFLTDPTVRDCIVTNPPFSLAQEFVTHAVDVAKESFLLLRVNFLGAQKRREWWPTYRPNCLFILSERPDFTGAGGDSTEYSWMYFGRRHQGIIWL